MSVKASFDFANTDDLKAQIVLTMTVGEWKKVKEDLDEAKRSYLPPAVDVVNVIRALIADAEKHFEYTRKWTEG